MSLIAETLDPILTEMENAIWAHEAEGNRKIEYPDSSLRSSTKIFMSVLMDKIFDLTNHEKMDMQDRCNMAQRCGEDLRKLIKTYANIDTHDFYKS